MHSLDSTQQAVFDDIVELCERTLSVQAHRPVVALVHGVAGTGKSALLASLFQMLSERSRRRALGDPLADSTIRMMVNHAEMWRRYRDFAGDMTVLRKSQVLRPTSYINAADKQGAGADVALVDEAHLLLTQPNPYTHFMADNQLAEIVRLSRITVLAYDGTQVLRMRSMWNDTVLKRALGDAEIVNFSLGNQHRMGASDTVRDWIGRLLNGEGRVTPPPCGDEHFDMKVFSDAGAMRDAVVQHAEHGTSRMLSTYDYPYRLDGKDYFIEEPGLRIRWDRYEPQAALSWPDRPETLDEVGSVYTIQGLDLDWAGVILGPSNVLGEDGKLHVRPDLYQDQAAFVGVSHLRQQGYSLQDIESMRQRLLRNALMTLLTRARKGLFLYAHDTGLREALLGA
ncbi:DUF2075 domain-containing protein [Bifidobacterium crudilactis]|jgi:DUF2075 family protein|uniref:DUF2075 domain-containing protein n=1 Tax=Bifidobacterium crudilactis TaxID=327277 RepID=UPI002F354240|nr:DUF2075 domain-containing protein [Bifidobacterium crudilactis]